MNTEFDAAAVKAFAIEMSRDPKEGLSARDRAMMACIVIPAKIQQWMVEAGAVNPLLDSIEKTILAAEDAASGAGQAAQDNSVPCHACLGTGNAPVLSGADQKAPADLDSLRREGAVTRKRHGRELEGLGLDRDEIGRALDMAAKLEWQTMPYAFREQAIHQIISAGSACDICGAGLSQSDTTACAHAECPLRAVR